MSTESLSGRSSTTAGYLTAVIALCVIALIGYVSSIFSPALHAKSQRRIAAEINEESRSFCVALGLSAGTALYARCEQGLEDIRTRQQQRSNASQAGIL
jgi:hypothetical protein